MGQRYDPGDLVQVSVYAYLIGCVSPLSRQRAFDGGIEKAATWPRSGDGFHLVVHAILALTLLRCRS